jgi:hypothetical protein
MSNIKARLERIENSLFGVGADQYRQLCLCFNLKQLSDEDLNELELSSLERRPCDPGVERRAYAPIPPDTPQYFIDKAKALMSRPVDIDGEDIDREKAYQEALEFRDELKRLAEAGLGYRHET